VSQESHAVPDPAERGFVGRIARTAQDDALNPRYIKVISIIDFLRTNPKWLGWLLLLDADSFFVRCSKSLEPWKARIITDGKQGRLRGDKITEGLWP